MLYTSETRTLMPGEVKRAVGVHYLGCGPHPGLCTHLGGVLSICPIECLLHIQDSANVFLLGGSTKSFDLFFRDALVPPLLWVPRLNEGSPYLSGYPDSSMITSKRWDVVAEGTRERMDISSLKAKADVELTTEHWALCFHSYLTWPSPTP